MYQRILVAIDGSEAATRGLKEAVALAAALKAELRVLHVTNDFAVMVELAGYVDYEAIRESTLKRGKGLLDEAQALAAGSGVTAVTVLRELSGGPVADAIVHEAATAGCDLLVLGTHGRRGWRRAVLGSDAENVLRICPLPVLLVRDPAAPV